MTIKPKPLTNTSVFSCLLNKHESTTRAAEHTPKFINHHTTTTPHPPPPISPRLPSSSSFTSRAAFSPSSRRFLSIILLRSTAALSSVLSVHPILDSLSLSLRQERNLLCYKNRKTKPLKSPHETVRTAFTPRTHALFERQSISSGRQKRGEKKKKKEVQLRLVWTKTKHLWG